MHSSIHSGLDRFHIFGNRIKRFRCPFEYFLKFGSDSVRVGSAICFEKRKIPEIFLDLGRVWF